MKSFFEEFWNSIYEDLAENCENRLDIWDAEKWIREAFEAGQSAGKEEQQELHENNGGRM